MTPYEQHKAEIAARKQREAPMKDYVFSLAKMQGLNLYNYFSPAGRGARTQRPTRVQHVKSGNKVKIIKHY